MSKKEKKKYSLWSNYKYVYGTVWRTYKSAFFYPVAKAVCDVITTLMAVALPAIVVYCLEKQLSMKQIILVLGGSFLFAGAVNFLKSYCYHQGREVHTEIRLDGPTMQLAQKELRVDYELLEREDCLQMKEKAFGSCSGNNWGFENFLTSNENLLQGVMGLLTYSLLLTTVEPLLVLILFGISLLQFAVFGKVRNYQLGHRDEKAKQNRFFMYFQNIAFDAASGKDIRLFSLYGWLMEIYENQLKNYKMLVRKERTVYFLYDLLGLGLQLVRDIACYGYLLNQIYNGMNISEFMIFLGVVSGFGTWFTTIFECIGSISVDRAMICDLQEWLDYPDTLWKANNEVDLNKTDALDIVFDHVSYRYPGAEKNVLEDVNFHIKAGEKIALVGINGAGKSTLVKLLCGLYSPTSGKILINGIDISTMDRDAYQKVVAPVFQDFVQLSFSIAENVAAESEEKIDWKRCEEALSAAGLGSKIKQLPKGAHTFINKVLDKEGIELSGGEKQKLILARVLYKQAKLVLLDEPTAAMDSIAEAETYQLYGKVLNKQTTLFISHRLASTRFCDRILLLDQGKITEEGSHEELLQKQGIYAKMYEVQKQYYVKGGEQV